MGPKLKSLLYGVKGVDSDERCCKVSLVYTDIPEGIHT